MTWTCDKCGLRFARECVHNCVDRPRPKGKFPPLKTQVWNLAKSLAEFVAHPGFCSAETYQARLKACDTCDSRRNRRCLECGCGIDLKARGEVFTCDLGRWPTEDSAAQS